MIETFYSNPHILAVVKITHLRTAEEIRYIQKEISYSNITCDRRVLNTDEEFGEISFAMVVDDYDYAKNYVDNWVRTELRKIVSRFRTYDRVDKDDKAPFTRHFSFLISPEASMPINYTVEYRADYDKDYIPDDISAWLKSKDYGLINKED